LETEYTAFLKQKTVVILFTNKVSNAHAEHSAIEKVVREPDNATFAVTGFYGSTCLVVSSASRIVRADVEGQSLPIVFRVADFAGADSRVGKPASPCKGKAEVN
jgi:hypothetical protein